MFDVRRLSPHERKTGETAVKRALFYACLWTGAILVLSEILDPLLGEITSWDVSQRIGERIGI